MRKLTFLVVIVLVALSSCKQKASTTEQEKQEAAPAPEEEQGVQNPLLAEYERFLAKLDSSKVENMSKAAERYKELFKNQPLTLVDSGYVLFDKFYERVDNTINEAHFTDTTDYSPMVVLSYEGAPPVKLSKKLRSYKQLIEANGFQVAMTEGMTYLRKDKDFLERHFYSHVSRVLKQYLAQMNKENKEGFAEDAGLVIGPTQFADRIIWRENFLKANPDFILKESVESSNKALLFFFLEGMDNSPVQGYDDNKLDPYYAEAYQYLNKKAPDSKANELVKPYFVALQKGDTAKAKRLLTQYKLDKAIDY